MNNGSNLIQYVADHHNNTIVVLEAPGPVDMAQWNAHPNVTAILFSYFGGQEMGSAVANVAFGQVNPSGKLPFTLAKQVSDYPLNLYNGSITLDPIAKFTEGDFIDYKVSLTHHSVHSCAPLTFRRCSTLMLRVLSRCTSLATGCPTRRESDLTFL